jgi:hypothetical protein
VGELEGTFFSRAGGQRGHNNALAGKPGVVVFGDIYTTQSDEPAVVLGDPIASYVLTGSGTLAKNDVHNVFRGLMVVIDSKPRLGAGSEQPPPYVLSSAKLLFYRFKVIKGEMAFVLPAANNAVRDLTNVAADGSAPAVMCKVEPYAPKLQRVVRTLVNPTYMLINPTVL